MDRASTNVDVKDSKCEQRLAVRKFILDRGSWRGLPLQIKRACTLKDMTSFVNKALQCGLPVQIDLFQQGGSGNVEPIFTNDMITQKPLLIQTP